MNGCFSCSPEFFFFPILSFVHVMEGFRSQQESFCGTSAAPNGLNEINYFPMTHLRLFVYFPCLLAKSIYLHFHSQSLVESSCLMVKCILSFPSPSLSTIPMFSDMVFVTIGYMPIFVDSIQSHYKLYP